jgi:hypothetical protein
VTGSGNECNVATAVDVRMQPAATGAAACVALNTAPSGSQYVSLVASLTLQADGTQTLNIAQATSTSTSVSVITYGGLPAQPTDLHLLIDPATPAVAVTINGVQRGTFPVSRLSLSGSPPLASLYATGGAAKFSYARVRILRSMP